MTVQTIRSIVGAPSTAPSIADSILIIVDAQGEYAEGLLRVNRVTETRAVIASLLGRYRAAKAPVVHVVAEGRAGAPIFTPGTALIEIFPELAPQGEETLISKRHASAFTGTTLQEVVNKTGRRKLVVVGYMAHNCVSATVRAGAELGYDLYAVQDAVGDRDIPGATAEELVRVSLAEVADVVATVVNSTDIY